MEPLPFDILSYDYLPPIGGQGVFTKELSEELLRRSSGTRVFAPGLKQSEIHHPFPHYLPKAPHTQHLASLLVSLQLETLIRDKHIKRLFVNTGPGGILLRHKPSVPTLVYSHLTYSQAIRFFPKNRWKSIFLSWEKRTYQVADRVLANSLSTKEEICSRYDIPENKVEVVYPGVAGEVPRRQYEDRTPYSLIYVGRLVPRKGIYVLLEAFRAAKTTLPQLSLTIVGDGSERTRIERLLRDCDLSDSVTLRGHLSKGETYAALSTSLVTVVPSFFEGFGLVAVESLRAGTPVIASDVSGLCEIIQHNMNGRLVSANSNSELAGAIRSVFTSKDEWQRLHLCSEESSRAFNWNHTASQIDTIFNRLVRPTSLLNRAS